MPTRHRADRRGRRGRRGRHAAPGGRASLAPGTKLQDVSFDLYPGEVLGRGRARGPGPGRAVRHPRRLGPPERRRAARRRPPVSFRHPADAIRAGLVYVAGRPRRGPADAALRAREHRAAVHGPAPPLGPDRPRPGAAARSTTAIDRLQIDTRAQGEVRRLSGGNQQKVTIARWVAGGVRTMLCFDPTRGIDIRTKQQIYVLLRDLAEAGAAVLLYTSELKEIQLVCDRAIVIFGGRVVAEIDARRRRRAGAAAGRLQPAARTRRCPRRSPPRRSPPRPMRPRRRPTRATEPGRPRRRRSGHDRPEPDGARAMTPRTAPTGERRRAIGRRRRRRPVGAQRNALDARPARVPRPPPRLHQAHPAELRRRPASRASRSPSCRSPSRPSAQAIVVISGGIDLSIGSMMALTSVVAAVADEGPVRRVRRRASSSACSCSGCVLGAINGSLDRRHPRARHRRHAGDVVRLGRLRAARPAAPRAAARRTGSRSSSAGRSASSGSPRRPSSCSSSSPLIWIPLRRSRLGLSIYAIGSNRLAAFRSGVSVGRTKIVAYALTGLFAALAGLSRHGQHRHRRRRCPAPYTLLSVAAVVLGGVSLAGGRGGVFGPIVAVLILPADPDRHDVPQRRHRTSRRSRPGRHPHRRGHDRQPRPAPAERAR